MKTLLLVSVIGVFGFATDLRASYTLSGTDGNLGASANFSYSNGVLTVTLTNTSSATVNSASQVLTGVYFNVTGVTPTFSDPSSSNPSGTKKIANGTSSTLGSATSANTMWGYDAGLSGTPYGMSYGFLATALTSSCTGSACGTTISGTNLTDTSFKGGLVDKSTVSGPVASTTVYDNSVIFTLDVSVPRGMTFSTADISSVAFQFGDAGLGDTDFEVVPEPFSYSGAIMLLLIPVIWHKRRRSAKSENAA